MLHFVQSIQNSNASVEPCPQMSRNMTGGSLSVQLLTGCHNCVNVLGVSLDIIKQLKWLHSLVKPGLQKLIWFESVYVMPSRWGIYVMQSTWGLLRENTVKRSIQKSCLWSHSEVFHANKHLYICMSNCFSWLLIILLSTGCFSVSGCNLVDSLNRQLFANFFTISAWWK